MAVPQETIINVGGEDYILTPSFYAILDIEQRTGKSINIITHSCSIGTISFQEMVVVLWAGIRATYRKEKKNLAKVPEFETLCEKVQQDGYLTKIATLVNFLTSILEGSQKIQEPEGKDEKESEKN